MSDAPLTASEICQLLDDLALCPDLRERLEALLATTVEHEHHRAYELIGAAEITKSLPAECNACITNPRQAWALTREDKP